MLSHSPAPNVTQLDGYFELYNATATAIAAVDPLISVGGPATAALNWVPEFINFTQGGAAVPAHFLSTHSYPTDYSAAEVTRTIWEGAWKARQALRQRGTCGDGHVEIPRLAFSPLRIRQHYCQVCAGRRCRLPSRGG